MLLNLTCRVVLLSVVVAVPGFAQAAGKAPATPPPVTAPRATPPAAATSGMPEDRSGYDPAGRRDPFVSLLSRGESKLPLVGRPNGVRGLLIGELSVRGVLRTNGALLAIVQAPDNKTYTLHPGDTLYDGTVKVVGPDAVVFLQRVEDPLSPVKQREIRKSLRNTEESR